ncbi:MAG TPA: c-type cytochrome [Gallionellaceae bacterium]|nr:c-type cytochrome [Gallionellaceae bacterium]
MALIAVFAIVAFAAKRFLTAETFYQYGHYRGAAVAEVASKVPKLQGSASCQSCHKEVYAEWAAGIHRKATKNDVVQGVVIKNGPNCEVCHTGPAGNHPSKEAMPLSIEDRVTTITHLDHEVHPADVPGRKLLLSPEDMQGICLNCHEKLEARPKEQPQVEVDRHSGKELCTTCHNPHSPRVNFAAIPRPPVDSNTGKPIPVSAEQAGDAGAGKHVAAACAACHGKAGMSVNPEWPNLAGQHANYLNNSLKAFKSGTRKSDVMSGMAAGLSDADMRNVAAYFAKASCGVTGHDKAKAEMGKAKAAEAGCAACHHSGGLHGPGAAGISASQAWPNLAGQNAGYLTVALKSFKDDSRSHPVMSSVAKALSDSDIDSLSAYYASASCKGLNYGVRTK